MLRTVQRQEYVVEREVSCGILQSKVDRGFAINVCEVEATAAAGVVSERARAGFI